MTRRERALLVRGVDDDGRGFDEVRTARRAGVTNMEDRLDSLEGTRTMTSEPGRVSRISGSFPLPASTLTE